MDGKDTGPALTSPNPHGADARSAQQHLRAENRELRRELAQVRDRYFALFERAPDAYLVTNADGIIEEVNAAAEAMFGVPRRLLVGKSLRVYLRGDTGAFERALKDLRRGHAVSEVALCLHRRKGEPVDVGVTATATHDARGDVAHLRWIVRDISERKRAEEAARALNAELEERVRKRTSQLETLARAQEDLLTELGRERGRLEAVLRQMPGGTIIADAPSGRLLLANKEAERILGMTTAGPADGVSGHAPGPADDGHPYRPGYWPLWRSLALGETVSAELIELVRPDGAHVVLEVNSAPIRDAGGTIVAGVVTFYDVSERERRARAERDFVTNAAHELRTPLAAIVSSVEVLQAGAKERPEVRDRFMGHIEQQSRRLQRLVHALLVLARASIRDEPPALERVLLRPLLADVARELEPKDGVELVTRCSRDVAVLGDRALLEEVLVNLGSNAARHVECGHIALTAKRRDGSVVLEVADTGPGMPDEVRDRALERFFRGPDASGAGFGLGLAIAAQSVKTLGGALEIDSRPEVGTTVRITLPSPGSR